MSDFVIGISVLLLTKNEEKDLPGCLASVAWSDDVVVYDSLSTDQTKNLALGFGARFVQRPGQDPSVAYGGNEGIHRTWGIHEIPYKHPWIFVIDADERLTPEAAAELRAIACNPDPRVVEGDVGDLQHPLDHYPFSKGLSHWIARHNSYSSFEAQQILQNRVSQEPFSLPAAFFERDFNRRRFHQKELFYRLPARPLIKFLLLYILKRGFLDGRPGFTYALLQSIYEAMIVLKVQELEQPQASLPPAG
jgi:glycosyltransferase involved in cell wall biosynthesis